MEFSLDKAFGIHVAALKLRAQRTELIAENIANVDTPGYKARDIDFQAALKSAMANDTGTTLKTTNPGHIPGDSKGAGMEQMMYRVPYQSSLDGNTVEANVEQAAFTRNAVEYQASLKFLEGSISGILKAIKGE